MPLCDEDSDSSSEGEVEDDDAEELSHVGMAAYEILRTKHHRRHHELWNVTSGVIIGEAHQTPKGSWKSRADANADNHDDWFPQALCDHMSKTQIWCDVMSLGVPDGAFMTKTKEALGNICRTAESKDEPIIVRMMFGNIVGMPVNCDAVIKDMTSELTGDENIRLWVGAWRRGTSWNHAKIIAVDGHHLWTGGHNFWDQHYLRCDPVHDLSMLAEGRVAHDGHLFANQQWHFIEHNQRGVVGWFVSKLPDNLPTILQTRVTVSEWPPGVADEFPPEYYKALVPWHKKMDGHVPIISMGRYGSMLWRARASDCAIIAMLDSARSSIKMALQDLGPICLPGLDRVAVPGCVWPKDYMEAMARGIWDRDVEVHIALSNPLSIPGGLSPLDALYGNGWKCEDVASEIVKCIKAQFSCDDDELYEKVRNNLKLCYIKEFSKNTWSTGKTLGMHAKHFIIDDQCYYIGSQNLYIADLAEWGLVIDDARQTRQIMGEYWHPMWQNSFTEAASDCDYDKVMDTDNLEKNRNGQSKYFLDAETKEAMKAAERRHYKAGSTTAHFDSEDEDD